MTANGTRRTAHATAACAAENKEQETKKNSQLSKASEFSASDEAAACAVCRVPCAENSHRATLLAGGNMGDVREALARARALVEARVGRLVRATPIRRTAPWGMEGAADFLNQIWIVDTPLAPLPLLDALEAIERELGRAKIPGRRDLPYASRTMDIDILYYGDLRLDTPRLTLPHPRIGEREFVIDLLGELSEKG